MEIVIETRGPKLADADRELLHRVCSARTRTSASRRA
jgi:hypothetical protein